MLVAEFQARKPLFEKHLAAAAKDTGSLFAGPLGKLINAEDAVKRLWSLSSSINYLPQQPKDPWEMVKALKTIGFAQVSEFTRVLAQDDPFRMAWTPLSTLVSTCQLIVDLGVAGKDAAVLHALGQQATAVRDEYGESMVMYAENREEIDQRIEMFGKMARAAEIVDAQMQAAQAAIDAAGASAPDFYYPFS